jgi:RNA polymerase sigma-70 factor (ECF subfamily)
VSDETLCAFDKGMVDNYEDFDLQKALEALPDKYRTVIVLRYFEDLKIEEIAEILNENINTVKTHLYKSLEKLRIHMSELSEED